MPCSCGIVRGLMSLESKPLRNTILSPRTHCADAVRNRIGPKSGCVNVDSGMGAPSWRGALRMAQHVGAPSRVTADHVERSAPARRAPPDGGSSPSNSQEDLEGRVNDEIDEPRSESFELDETDPCHGQRVDLCHSLLRVHEVGEVLLVDLLRGQQLGPAL